MSKLLPSFQDMMWSDCFGRWHFYYYVCAYKANEVESYTIHAPCICERREWEILKRTKRSNLPKDYYLMKNEWRKKSSLNRGMFDIAVSNHYTFMKVRVLSPIETQSDFIEIIKTPNMYTLFDD